MLAAVFGMYFVCCRRASLHADTHIDGKWSALVVLTGTYLVQAIDHAYRVHEIRVSPGDMFVLALHRPHCALPIGRETVLALASLPDGTAEQVAENARTLLGGDTVLLNRWFDVE